MDLAEELAAARLLDITALADEIESIGFTCQQCGACCTAEGEQSHTATIFPREIRAIEGSWTATARPMPYGFDNNGPQETFEWALQVDDCGDCVFHDKTDGCQIYERRPLICRSYPFQVDPVNGHVETGACPGVGKEMSREEARQLAVTLKRRAIREREEALAVQANYEPTEIATPVVHDSEGAKRPDGTPIQASPAGTPAAKGQHESDSSR